MATIGNLIINIGAKIDGLRKGLSDSTSLIQGAKSKIEGLGGVLSTSLKAGAVVAGGALLSVGVGAVALGPQLVGLGSDAEEMMGKFNVVFAQTGAGVTNSLGEFGAQVGRNKYELMGYAATIGDTLKPMGFAEQEAANLSVQMVKLATDLGSFNNMETDEALQRLQGTLIGNHENALAFGVVINENTLKAELAANGWDKLTGAQLEQAKVQARINLLMKGTTDAQGDAARTSGSWANQMRALQATLTQTGTEIGLKLLPVITPLLMYLGSLAREYLPLVIDLIAQWIPQLQQTGTAIAAQVMPWLTALGIWLINVGWPAVQQFAGQVLSQLIPGLMQLGTWAMQIGQAVLPLLGQAIQFVIDHFNIFGPILGVIGVLLLAIASPVTLVIGLVVLLATAWANNWGGIQSKTQAVIDFIWPYIQAAMSGIQSIVTTVLSYVQAWWQKHGASVMTIVQGFMNLVMAIILTVAGLIKAFWDQWGKEILTIAQANWNNIKVIVDTTMNLIGFIIDAIAALIRGDWEAFGDALEGIWRTVWNGIKAIVENSRTALGAAVRILIDAVKSIWETGIGAIKSKWSELWDKIKQKVDDIAGPIKTIINDILSWVQSAIDALKRMIGLQDEADQGPSVQGASFPGSGGGWPGWGSAGQPPAAGLNRSSSTEIHLHYYGSAPGNPVQDLAMLQALAVT